MDTKSIIHVGAEVVLIGGITYYLNTRVNRLEAELTELKNQMSRLALHVKNTQQEQGSQLKTLNGTVDKLKRQRERTSDRDLIRKSVLEEPKSRRAVEILPSQDDSSESEEADGGDEVDNALRSQTSE